MARVLNLPTIGPLYINALVGQDMYMAGTVLVFIVGMIMLGSLLADIALAALDPRIRLE
jgi:peptide/nickel transport system permease protein